MPEKSDRKIVFSKEDIKRLQEIYNKYGYFPHFTTEDAIRNRSDEDWNNMPTTSTPLEEMEKVMEESKKYQVPFIERVTSFEEEYGLKPINIKLLPGAVLPKYATPGSAGMDLYAHLSETIVLEAHQSVVVPTGLFIEIPEGFEGQIRSKSGIASKNQVVVLNSPGTIDCDYKGEVKVILFNHGNHSYSINPLDKIAQLVICPIIQVKLNVVDGIGSSIRGEGGFGSTGK